MLHVGCVYASECFSSSSFHPMDTQEYAKILNFMVCYFYVLGQILFMKCFGAFHAQHRSFAHSSLLIWITKYTCIAQVNVQLNMLAKNSLPFSECRVSNMVTYTTQTDPGNIRCYLLSVSRTIGWLWLTYAHRSKIVTHGIVHAAMHGAFLSLCV